MHNATPCDRKMETGADHIIQSCHSSLSESGSVNCAVVAVISSERDAGCDHSHFVFIHFNSFYVVQHLCSGTKVKVELK